MRIVCPACSAAYEVPDTLLGAGRPVRCARCGTEWAPEPVAAPPAPAEVNPGPRAPASIVERSRDLAPAAEPPPAAAVHPPLPTEERGVPDGEASVEAAPTPVRSGRRTARVHEGRAMLVAVRIGWAASVAIIAGLAWAAYAWRVDIMHAWPPSERVYIALGLA